MDYNIGSKLDDLIAGEVEIIKRFDKLIKLSEMDVAVEDKNEKGKD